MNTSFLAERARYLRLASLSVSEGMRTGAFQSRFRGQGMEFDAVREYERGDDIRSIDWNVTARSNRAFVKVYREERELTVFLVLDVSHSMGEADAAGSKTGKALEAAALFAFAAEQNASPVGASVFALTSGTAFRPRAGKNHILSMLTSLERSCFDRGALGNGSSLSSALAGAARVLRNKSLVVILSDFRLSGYEKNLGLLSRKHDVLACRIVSPFDSVLPECGLLPVRDPENGWESLLSTSHTQFKSLRERDYVESIERWEQICRRRGVFPLLLSTAADTVKELSSFFVGVKR